VAIYQRRYDKKLYPEGRKSEDWYVSWYVGPKQYRKRIGPNKREAELFLKDIELKRVRGELLGIHDVKRIPFETLAKEYLVWAKGRKAKHTIEAEESSIGRFKVAFPGVAAAISRDQVERFLSGRLVTVGPATHNRDLSILRVIFRKATEWGYCRRSPAEGIKKLQEPPGRVRFLSPEERTALLDACSADLRNIVEVAVDSGLRKSELLSLRWQDVDAKNRMVRVEHSKNGERRDIPMTDRVAEIFQSIPKRVDSPFVFANPDGVARIDVKTAWATAVDKAKIEDLHFHDLRHTFASYLVMGGVDLRTVQTLLGHKDIHMTVRYSHLSPAHLRDAIAVLGRGRVGSKSDQRSESAEKAGA
jgi:integrase